MLFDRSGAEEVLDLLGIGSAYAAERKRDLHTSKYVCRAGCIWAIGGELQLLDSDSASTPIGNPPCRRLAGGDFRELMSLHVNAGSPRCAFPEDVAAKWRHFRTPTVI